MCIYIYIYISCIISLSLSIYIYIYIYIYFGDAECPARLQRSAVHPADVDAFRGSAGVSLVHGFFVNGLFMILLV